MKQQQPRRRISSAINRLNIALAIIWLKLNHRRWFIEYNDDDDYWQLITD